MCDWSRLRVLWCLGILAAWNLPAAPAADKPNILFVIADDQSFETIRSLGNPEIETPHLDRLVRRGTTFTHCYNMGSWSGAVCVASRTMLNSGRYLWRAEAIYERSEAEREAGRWWSEIMKQAGYRTYMTGKWHLKASAPRSFDVVADVRGGMPQQTEAGYDRPRADRPDPWSPSDPRFGGYWAGGTHWSEVVGNHATDFLADASTRDEPFFMYVAFNAPHDPRQSPRQYVDRYPAEQILLPRSFQPLYPLKDAIGCGADLRDERLAPFPRTPQAVQVHRQEYYAIITHMDNQIGRILDALEASGKADNTWIFFTADHGLAVGNHGLFGKQNMYDHSLRVPFMVVGPGVESGRRIDEPIYLQDVMPTVLELAEAGKPAHVDFHSLRPILAGRPSPYDAIYGAYLDLQRCIRTREHKLIIYPEAKRVRLYDLQNDPQEMHDLAGDPDSLPLIRELFARFEHLQTEVGDSLDVAADFPDL